MRDQGEDRTKGGVKDRTQQGYQGEKLLETISGSQDHRRSLRRPQKVWVPTGVSYTGFAGVWVSHDSSGRTIIVKTDLDTKHSR